MTSLLLPVGPGRTYRVDAARLQVDIWWLHALMVLMGVAATAGFTLRQLRVEPRRLIGLAHLHALHGLTAAVPLLRIVACGRPSCRVYDNLLAVRGALWRFHGVQPGGVLGTDLTAH